MNNSVPKKKNSDPVVNTIMILFALLFVISVFSSCNKQTANSSKEACIEKVNKDFKENGTSPKYNCNF